MDLALQDVFSELIAATRVATPIEHVGAWLFRVATNRITDRFRRRTQASLDAPATRDDDDGDRDAAPSPSTSTSTSEDAGPDARCADRAFLCDLRQRLAPHYPQTT